LLLRPVSKYPTKEKTHLGGWVFSLVELKGLAHVPQARNYIFESIAFKSKFPCKMPQAFITLDPGIKVSSPQFAKKKPTSEGGIFLWWS